MFGLLKGFFEPPKRQRAPRKTTMTEVVEGISLKYQKHPFSRSIKISIKGNKSALVTMPRGLGFKHAQDFVRQSLPWLHKNFEKYSAAPAHDTETLRRLAKSILPARLEELAKKHGFEYKGLRINNARTRWGSCSFKNNINLNLNLARLDDELIEYVILHELCHTKVKNHSKKFWDLLCSHLPEALERRRILKKIKIV